MIPNTSFINEKSIYKQRCQYAGHRRLERVADIIQGGATSIGNNNGKQEHCSNATFFLAIVVEASFTFNCYKHWIILIVRTGNGLAIFIFSKEGVTQGDPLAMIAYGILLLPLIRSLKEEIPDVDQP